MPMNEGAMQAPEGPSPSPEAAADAAEVKALKHKLGYYEKRLAQAEDPEQQARAEKMVNALTAQLLMHMGPEEFLARSEDNPVEKGGKMVDALAAGAEAETEQKIDNFQAQIDAAARQAGAKSNTQDFLRGFKEKVEQRRAQRKSEALAALKKLDSDSLDS